MRKENGRKIRDSLELREVDRRACLLLPQVSSVRCRATPQRLLFSGERGKERKWEGEKAWEVASEKLVGPIHREQPIKSKRGILSPLLLFSTWSVRRQEALRLAPACHCPHPFCSFCGSPCAPSFGLRDAQFAAKTMAIKTIHRTPPPPLTTRV